MVRRDGPDGVLPICSHLGGPLHWNDCEQSWDCPLHGSRFAEDGQVLEGPATRPLKRRALAADQVEQPARAHRSGLRAPRRAGPEPRSAVTTTTSSPRSRAVPRLLDDRRVAVLRGVHGAAGGRPCPVGTPALACPSSTEHDLVVRRVGDGQPAVQPRGRCSGPVTPPAVRPRARRRWRRRRSRTLATGRLSPSRSESVEHRGGVPAPMGVPASRSAPGRRPAAATTSSSPLNRAPATGDWSRLVAQVDVGAALDRASAPSRRGRGRPPASAGCCRRRPVRRAGARGPRTPPAPRSCPRARSASPARPRWTVSSGLSGGSSLASATSRQSRCSPGSPLSSTVSSSTKAELGRVGERLGDRRSLTRISPTVGHRGDPRRHGHVAAEVVALALDRGAGVQSDAHPDRRTAKSAAALSFGAQRALDVERGAESELGRREHHHVAVALALHDHGRGACRRRSCTKPVVRREQLDPLARPRARS